MSGTRDVIKQALTEYGFSAFTADKLIEELLNPGSGVVPPVTAGRFGVMETREGGKWVAWDRVNHCTASVANYATEQLAQTVADSLNSSDK